MDVVGSFEKIVVDIRERNKVADEEKITGTLPPELEEMIQQKYAQNMTYEDIQLAQTYPKDIKQFVEKYKPWIDWHKVVVQHTLKTEDQVYQFEKTEIKIDIRAF